LFRAHPGKPDGDKARELAKQGVDVVTGELDDVESLKKAFNGAHSVYCVTDFWEHMSPEKEITQARNIAEATKTAGKHFGTKQRPSKLRDDS
jgi:uncharacterized protein YbjT (DUF2867 family)